MPFTTRFWVSTAGLLCTLLVQSYQSHSVSATEAEELTSSASALSVHQRASGESLSVSSISSATHDAFACLTMPPLNREELPTAPSARSLSFSEFSPTASVGNPPEVSKLSTKRRYINMTPDSNKKTRDGEEQGYMRRAALGILLSIAGAEPDKVAKLLEVILVAAQDKEFRQPALEALGNMANASPNTFSACLSSLRVAAQGGDKTVRLLALKTLGEVEWKHYFGEVGSAPDLSKDITQILDAPCPFWPERKVRDTHLLVFIPAEVDGKPFTLNLLGELIKAPKGGGSKTQYGNYDGNIKTQVGNEAPASSYWVLLTRDVLPGSRDKTYATQKELVAGHTRRTGLHYELPKALEVATAVLTHHVRTGERLYGDDPLTWARCQELIRYSSSAYPSLVGGFESSGLFISHSRRRGYGRYDSGVAGCRKFF